MSRRSAAERTPENTLRTSAWLAPAAQATSSPAAGTDSPAPASAASGSAASGGGGAASDINACTLLSAAKAAGEVGRQYTSAVSATIAAGQDQCTYHAADGSSDLVIIVYQPSSGVTWQMMNTVLNGAGDVKAVGGVGDKAMVGQI